MAKKICGVIFAVTGLAEPVRAFLPYASSVALAPRINSLEGCRLANTIAAVARPRGAAEPFKTMPSKRRREFLRMRNSSASDAEVDPRQQALNGVLHQIERCYGRGSILKMGDTASMHVETTPSGELLVMSSFLDGIMARKWLLIISYSWLINILHNCRE